MDDVQYMPAGQAGRQCKNCKFFEAPADAAMGKCFGHDVQAIGSCNKFVSKA